MRKRLTDYRKSKGISQLEMAEKIGVTRTYYNYLETGRVKLSVKMAIRISKILNYDLGNGIDLTELKDSSIDNVKVFLSKLFIKIDTEDLF